MRWILCLCLMLMPLAATAQDDDRGYLQALLEDNLSGAGREVRITGFEGALSSKASIEELTIADAGGIWLTLRGVELDWTRTALLAGRVEVNSLTAREILLPRAPGAEPGAPKAEATAFALPDLPVSVSISELRAEKVVLGQALFGTAATVSLEGRALLAGGEGEAALTIERIDGPEGRLALDGAYSNATRNLRLALQVTEGEDGIAAGLIGLPGTPAIDLTVAGDGPIDDFTAELGLRTAGEDRLSGKFGLLSRIAEGAPEGTAPTRSFTLNVAGDIAPLFLPEYRDFFGTEVTVIADGRRDPSGALSLSRLAIDAQALSVTGQAEIGADGLPEVLNLSGRIGGGASPVLLPLKGPQTRIGSARISVAFDAARGDEWTARAEVLNLDRPEADIARLHLDASGRIVRGAQATGPLVDGSVIFGAEGIGLSDAALARAIGENITGSFAALWQDGAPLRLSALRVDGAGYGLTGDVQISGLTVSGQAEARVADLARMSDLAGRSLGGRGTVSISGTATPLSGAFDAEATVAGTGLKIDMAEVDNLLAGDSWIALSARRDEQGTLIRDFSLDAATLSARASGWLRTAGSDLTGSLTLGDLAVLGPAYGGSLEATGAYKTTDGVADIRASATARDITIGRPEVDGLLTGETRLAIVAAQSDAGTELKSMTINGANLTATGAGWLRDNGRSFTGKVALADLSPLRSGLGGSLQAEGSYNETEGVARIQATASGDGLAIGNAEADKLLRGQSTFSLSANRTERRLRVEQLTFDNPQLTARAQALVEGETRRIDLNATLADLGLFTPDIPGPVTVAGRIKETGTGYDVDLSAKGPGGIDATVTGSVAADLKRADLAVSGQAQAVLANAFIAPVSIAGPVRFDLALNGAPAVSSLSGTIALSPARLSAPALGIALRDTAINLALADGRAQLDLRGSVESGGELQVSGPIGLTVPFPADLSVQLLRVTLMDPDLFTARLEGQVAITGPLAGGANITGRITLIETELRVPSAGLGGTAAIPDLRHMAEPAAVRATRARAGLVDTAKKAGGTKAAYGLDITVVAPNRMFVRGRGLDAELGGSLRMTGTTANIIPGGGFDLVRGRLDILGKRFSLDEGHLQFQGDFIPFVRLGASTSVEQVVATILVEGPASEPDIKFVSVPELPEEEVLSLILFGRDLTSISPFQAAQLASAVASLAGKGGEGIVGRLRKGFGLDNLDVQTSEGGASTVTAGKYLSRNLYTEVTVDDEGKSQINLNLDVSKSITVKGRATSDGTTGIGIYLERDY